MISTQLNHALSYTFFTREATNITEEFVQVMVSEKVDIRHLIVWTNPKDIFVIWANLKDALNVIQAILKDDIGTLNLKKSEVKINYDLGKGKWHRSIPPGAAWLWEEPHPAVLWLPRRHLQNVGFLLQNPYCEKCSSIFQGNGNRKRVLQHLICRYSGARGNICGCLLLQWRQVIAKWHRRLS